MVDSNLADTTAGPTTEKVGFLEKHGLRISDKKRTKAAELTLKESLWPIILVTVLFFLWGFSYGLLDTLNKHFQNTLGIDQTRSSGLQAAYFGAYPLASLGHAAWILRHFGYKAVFIWGLTLYGVGALLTIPAIIGKNFGGFCTCIFIIGNGLGSLETAANPYIAVCGPPKFSEMRINLSQAFNGIGAIMAPALGSYVFFTFNDEDALRNVQWVYLSIAIFVFCLAAVFFFTHIPEITDADMEFQAIAAHKEQADLPLRKQYRLWHAAASQFAYCAAQVSVAAFFINYAQHAKPEIDSSLGAKFYAGAQACFAFGRFVGVGLMHYFKPRLVFLIFIAGCVLFIIPAIPVVGDAGIALLSVVLFFESICFPTIVALGMRGLGKNTKRGSGWIIAGVIGGAVGPPLTGYTGDRHGSGISMVVPLFFFLIPLSYAVCVNFVPYYRNTADAFHETDVGVASGHHEGVLEQGELGHSNTKSSDEEKSGVISGTGHHHTAGVIDEEKGGITSESAVDDTTAHQRTAPEAKEG